MSANGTIFSTFLELHSLRESENEYPLVNVWQKKQLNSRLVHVEINKSVYSTAHFHGTCKKTKQYIHSMKS